MKKIITSMGLVVLLAMLSTRNSVAQNPFYTVNGDATQDDCNCYTLTPNVGTKHGSVWNNTKISLDESFDYNFTVFLGANESGADGIAFVLQPISTSVGSTGGGLGYEGVTPAVGITIDTYQNSDAGDPTYDHIAIQLNGDINHGTVNNVAGPVQALLNSPNIEDNQFHAFRVVWNAATHQMDAYMDGELRVSSTIDFVNAIFGGNPLVYWGFTGSTGGAMNLQRFCTQNIASFSLGNQPTEYCDTAMVFFQDESLSSSDVASWAWDFGDGATSTESSPTHHFSEPGTYVVDLNVTGFDGCVSETYSQTIKVHELPTADFTASVVCQGLTTTFQNISNSTDGNIATYSWEFGDNTGVSTDLNPTYGYENPGMYDATLIVSTNYGCYDTITKPVSVSPKPVVDFSVADTEGCSPFCVTFENASTIESGVVGYSWSFGDGTTSSQTSPKKCFTNNSLSDAHFTVSLTAISDKGCVDSVKKMDYITVASQPTASFNASSTSLLIGDTKVDFANTSTNATSYSWDFGDGTEISTSKNSTHTFPATAGEYQTLLTASNEMGCKDTASVTIVVLAPDPVYSIPNIFTPNGDGLNDVFQFVKSENVANVNVIILNRWGETVYESNAATFGWNGKLMNSGSICAAGVYFYTMKLTGLNGKSIEENGFFHLAR